MDRTAVLLTEGREEVVARLPHSVALPAAAASHSLQIATRHPESGATGRTSHVLAALRIERSQSNPGGRVTGPDDPISGRSSKWP